MPRSQDSNVFSRSAKFYLEGLSNTKQSATTFPAYALCASVKPRTQLGEGGGGGLQKTIYPCLESITTKGTEKIQFAPTFYGKDAEDDI
jgi:hypothetical protein